MNVLLRYERTRSARRFFHRGDANDSLTRVQSKGKQNGNTTSLWIKLTHIRDECGKLKDCSNSASGGHSLVKVVGRKKKSVYGKEALRKET